MERYQCPHCGKVFTSYKGGKSVIFCPHCNGVVVVESRELTPGTVIGGFEILRLLGKGGMGFVYLAKQFSLQRLVALKTISSDIIEDPNAIDKFRAEVQLSGSLNHPNIITALDAGMEGNVYYLAVTYIDGEDLEKRTDGGKCLPEKEVFQMALKIADALNYAWEKHRLLHNDIKPGNVIQDRKGEYFLMDLGIAQKIGSKISENEVIHGSPFYMSPEKIQGLQLDWRSDLYSLGATIYHLITGTPPFDADDVVAIIRKHLEEDMPDPKERNPASNVSKKAVSILKKMMCKKAEYRYGSWAEAQKEFKEMVDSAPDTKSDSIPTGTKTTSTSKIMVKSAGRIQPGQIAKSSSGKRTSPVRPKSSPLVQPAKADPRMQMLNYALVAVIAIVLGLFMRSCLKNSSALKEIEYAKSYSVKFPNNHDEILRLFRVAKEESKGTKHEMDAARLYVEATAMVQAAKEEEEAFDRRLNEALAVLGKKQYKESLKILDELSKTKDPHRKQKIMSLIVQIENVMKSQGE